MSLFDTLPVMGKGPTWEDLSPGMVGRTLRRTVTEADLVNFIGATAVPLVLRILPDLFVSKKKTVLR